MSGVQTGKQFFDLLLECRWVPSARFATYLYLFLFSTSPEFTIVYYFETFTRSVQKKCFRDLIVDVKLFYCGKW